MKCQVRTLAEIRKKNPNTTARVWVIALDLKSPLVWESALQWAVTRNARGYIQVLVSFLQIVSDILRIC